MKNLISMTDFVLQQDNMKNDFVDYKRKVLNYANFLKQPLELWMFVPCDEDNVPFKGKPLSPNTDAEWIRWDNEQEEFYKAKERCFFEKSKYGIVLIKEIVRYSKKIEDLIIYSRLDLKLTPTALKQIGL